MILITINPNTVQLPEWTERLQQMFIKYKIVEDPAWEEPRLQDGVLQLNGAVAIDKWLNEQSEFVKNWYEDRCNNYESTAGI